MNRFLKTSLLASALALGSAAAPAFAYDENSTAAINVDAGVMGAALGKKLDIDPAQFTVVGGRLYLNVNADVLKRWSQDIPTNIGSANENWPAIKDKSPNTL